MRSGNPFGTCAYCGKQIMWIRTKAGKNMPVNPKFVNYKRNPGGKDRIVLPSGDVIACDANADIGGADGYGYISHFATCKKYKRRRI